MLNVVFVEDERIAIVPILQLIRQEEPDIICHDFGFDEAEHGIRSTRPDIVVLDLWEGKVTEDKNKGSEYLKFIWNQQFCPVVIHSASPDIPQEHSNSFVREVTKGQNSPQQVLEAIRDLLPHVQALRGAEVHIRDSFSIAMRDVAPSTFDNVLDTEQRNDAIWRAGRRRLAALMDEISAEGRELASWEQYICPPVSTDILLGDILMDIDAEGLEPTSFRVVLTPSCDLVSTGVRATKVSNVLVAKCCSIKTGLDLTSLKGVDASKLRDRLISTVLSRGYVDTIIPLPALQGRIPSMVASLRVLELIPLPDIGVKDKRWCRIASLDSPFRELISWAYVQVAGRPGLLDRDFESWRDEVMFAYGEQ